MITMNGSIENSKLIYNYLTNLAENDKLWLAVGSGEDSWDTSLPIVDKNITKLVKEVSRSKVEKDDIVIVDQKSNPDEDTIVDSGSTIRVLGNIVCPLTPLREYGLFINGDETKDSGTLYSYDVHPKVVLGQLNLYMKYVYINF